LLTHMDQARWMSAARKLVLQEMKKYKIHPKVLAAEAGVGYVTVLNFIEGRTFNPTIRTVNALIVALGYPLINFNGTVVVKAKRKRKEASGE